ncbi:MAG: dTMP kinase [Xanthobacter sp.]
MQLIRGKFITLEGGEGTGKSTQARRLAAHLRTRGLNVLETREPGGSAGAEAVRHVLLSGAAQPFGSEAEALLFAAARADHMDETIHPALEAGHYVVCDRFIDSSRVYQGAVGQVKAELLDALEAVAIGENLPDLTLVLDVPTELGLSRAEARGKADRFEREGPAFHEAVRAAFLALAEHSPRHMVIDAHGSVEDVTQRMIAAVESRLFPPMPEQAELQEGAAS